MLTALAKSVPCEVRRFGPVKDNLEPLISMLDQAKEADVIVTSGGASVGDHDLVRPALEHWGAEIDFWRVAIKPGKPLLVARRGRQLVIGLPGNPVSSHVTAYFFLLPVLRALLGAAEPFPRAIRAALTAPLSAGGSRREFLRARWDGSGIAPLLLQDSGALSALAAADVLVDREAGGAALPTGAEVRVYLLQNGGMA
jgi:molybdopterin molybdotransferase